MIFTCRGEQSLAGVGHVKGAVGAVGKGMEVLEAGRKRMGDTA